MIPRAVEQVFRVAEELKTKGWEYTMEGQMLEIVSHRHANSSEIRSLNLSS